MSKESFAYRFDGSGNYVREQCNLTVLMSLTEGTGSKLCWYHVAFPHGNEKLSSFEKTLVNDLHPHLKQQDIITMVGAGPFCGHVDGALFFRVNSSGPALSEFSLRFAARVTENSVISVSMGLNGKLDFPPGQSLPLGSAVTEERDPESSLAMNHKEAYNSVPKTVGNLLVYIGHKCMDHLQGIVTHLEMELDRIEEQMGFLWHLIDHARAQTEIGVTREMWDDGRLPNMHLDLQRLLQIIAHVEQVFPRIKKKCTNMSWLADQDNASLEEASVGRLKENVGFIRSRVQATQAGFDSKQTALDSRQAAQINRKLYYLSILSVIFLPLSFITGIFGLSVGDMPWTGHKHGFLNVSLICGVTLVVLLACLFPVIYRHIKEYLYRAWITYFPSLFGARGQAEALRATEC